MYNGNVYQINYKNLLANFKIIKQLTYPKKICAVVKANAYGIGVENVAPFLSDYVDFFAVACIKEAIELRKLVPLTPILILGTIKPFDISLCEQYNLSITISGYEQLGAVRSVVQNSIHIHLKIETGLNRYGISSKLELKKCINAIKKNNALVLEGIYTHFATKSNDIEFMELQKARFDFLIKEYTSPQTIIHCCNSFATVNKKEWHNDMVRIGFILHGHQDYGLPIKPIIEISSEITFIHKVKKGQSIGYDRSFVAPQNMTVGVVGIGYADGIDRSLSNHFSLLVNGKKCKIVGKICMDACMIDITNFSNIFIGEKVVILGESKGKSITLNDYASSLNKSAYEVLLRFNYNRMNLVKIE